MRGRVHLLRALSALGVAVLVSACSSDANPGVTVAVVGRSTVVEVVQAPATVAARASAVVSSPADGTVAGLRVVEGAQVQAGDVLLRVESPAVRRLLRQALKADAQAASAASTSTPSTTLAGAQQADANARRSFAAARRAARQLPAGPARTQALSALRVSQSQYTAARASADVAAAQLAAGIGSLAGAVAALSSAQRVQTGAAVDSARREVAALTVRSPVAGTVSLSPPAAGSGSAGSNAAGASALLDQLPDSVRSQAGALLGGGAGSTSSVDAALAVGRPVSSGQPVLTVTDTSALALTAQVDETDVLLVKRGVPASAELDAVPDARYEATVRSIDPVPTTSSRGGVTYVVRLELGRGIRSDGTTAPTPRPGMSAVADLQVRTATDATAVPSAAVFRDGRRDAVWVVVNGRARQRTVVLGAQGQARVQVVQGLRAGERVVVRGADRVRADQKLR